MRPWFLVVVASCGGEAAPAAPAHPPPAEVLGLQVRVMHRPGREDTFCEALEVSLARSGIPIAGSPTQPADAVISCQVYESPDDSFIHITQNGESRAHFTVRVDVRNPQNVPVDQFVADYTGFKSAGPDDEAVTKVAVAFAYSPRIAAFARLAKSAPQPAVTTVQVNPPQPFVSPPPTASVDSNPQRDARDDAMWFGIDTVRCKVPANVDACIAVRSYLQRFPNGAHADEANQVLAAAQPALEKLQKDEMSWRKSSHGECGMRKTTDACVGVEAYDLQFPTGLHSDEAHRLLKQRH